MTPAELRALLKRLEWQQEAANWRAAVVAATVANSAGGKRRYRPEDFMPKRQERRHPSRRLTPEETAEVLKSWALSMGGKVIERA